MSKPANESGRAAASGFFRRVEAIGNRLPDPVSIFFILCAVVIVASALFAGATARLPTAAGVEDVRTVKSLLTRDGLRWMFTNAVPNFVGFRPLGPVLTILLGVGVAERAGLITTGLRMFIDAAPKHLVTPSLVFAGVMSSLVGDAGYVVLIPLGAMIFLALGRHPLAGLAATFAGVAGGFSANLFITSLDPMLARLTEQAAQVIDKSYTVNAASNWYFMIASTFLLTGVGTLVTNRLVEPALGTYAPHAGEAVARHESVSAVERSAFFTACATAVLMTAAVVAFVAWPGSPLFEEADANAPLIAKLKPFFESLEILVALLFLVPGIVFGVRVGAVKSDKDVARMMAESMGGMGGYIVLAFAAGQFVAFFNWTSLGAVTAVNGAALLTSIGLTGVPLMVGFVGVSALFNLFVGSASAKWSFFAPIFVPMLMLMGYSPETVQAVYRVGDSVTNPVAPLLPYIPIVIGYARRYEREAGLGTLFALMAPYSLAFLVSWTLVVVAWLLVGLPWGPGAPVLYLPR